jgi:hypothetical protein
VHSVLVLCEDEHAAEQVRAAQPGHVYIAGLVHIAHDGDVSDVEDKDSPSMNGSDRKAWGVYVRYRRPTPTRSRPHLGQPVIPPDFTDNLAINFII